MFFHLDMDCFYASVEMREYPQHDGKPLAVGGRSGRGVLTTCNYIAREFGVRSAMPVFQAKKLCPDLIVLPVRMKLYKQESLKVREILKEEFGEIEMASIDEAYMFSEDSEEAALERAKRLRERIYTQTQLPCSIGVAPNKMLAKIGSGFCKPDNQILICEEQIEEFMRELPVASIPGVGPKTQERLKAMNIVKCSDLWEFSLDELNSKFGVWGVALFDRARGRDQRSLSTHRERKSLSVERTFFTPLENQEQLIDKLEEIYPEFERRLREYISRTGSSVQKIYVILKFSNFQRTTLERVSPKHDFSLIRQLAIEAFERSNQPVRLAGIGARFRSPTRKPKNPRQLELL